MQTSLLGRCHVKPAAAAWRMQLPAICATPVWGIRGFAHAARDPSSQKAAAAAAAADAYGAQQIQVRMRMPSVWLSHSSCSALLSSMWRQQLLWCSASEGSCSACQRMLVLINGGSIAAQSFEALHVRRMHASTAIPACWLVSFSQVACC
jgi:hypothetical protein